MKRFGTGLVAGCWDCFHAGHRWFLDQAAKHCSRLIVLVATDESVRRLKHREPADGFSIRAANVERYASGVWPIEDHAMTTLDYWTQSLRPDVLIVGADQLHIPDKLRVACQRAVPLLILPRGGPPISTTQILEKRYAPSR